MTQFGIYIAGPMSNMKDYNRSAFLEGEDEVISMFQGENKVIFNPIKQETSLMIQQNITDNPQQVYRMCMKLNTSWICDHATHIYMLRGWENSNGAMAEWMLAKSLGLYILYQV